MSKNKETLGGSGMAMAPAGSGDFDQVKPANGSPWGESSAAQYSSPKVEVVTRGTADDRGL